MDINLLISKEQDLPVRTSLLPWSELLVLCDCPEAFLTDLLDMGWLAPAQSAHEADLYAPADIYRIRKLRRICEDFEVNLAGGTIIVDLLGRISELERKLQELESLMR